MTTVKKSTIKYKHRTKRIEDRHKGFSWFNNMQCVSYVYSCIQSFGIPYNKFKAFQQLPTFWVTKTIYFDQAKPRTLVRFIPM